MNEEGGGAHKAVACMMESSLAQIVLAEIFLDSAAGVWSSSTCLQLWKHFG